MSIETWKNPDKMSVRELRKEVKAWREALQEGSTMIAEDKIEVSTDMATDSLHVVILGQVDGHMPRADAPKLDAILNSGIPYETKLSQIRELCND